MATISKSFSKLKLSKQKENERTGLKWGLLERLGKTDFIRVKKIPDAAQDGPLYSFTSFSLSILSHERDGFVPKKLIKDIQKIQLSTAGGISSLRLLSQMLGTQLSFFAMIMNVGHRGFIALCMYSTPTVKSLVSWGRWVEGSAADDGACSGDEREPAPWGADLFSMTKRKWNVTPEVPVCEVRPGAVQNATAPE